MAVEKIKELKEIWENDIYRETLTMIPEEDGSFPELLYLPEGAVKVESYDGRTIYEQGRDYVIEGRSLRLPEGSGIPVGTRDDLYYMTEQEARQELAAMPYDLGFGPVSTADGKYITLRAIDHPEYLTKWQVCVSYKTKEEWWGKKPESKRELLPEFAGKCEKGETVRILIFGDSISCGYDCSGFHHQEPGRPIWPELVAKGLEEKGIAVADVQTVQKEIQKRKRYLDITGNWLNHPNDFLAGIQAQVVFRSLT